MGRSDMAAAVLQEPNTCGICNGTLVDGVKTRCGHSFCEDCLIEWLTPQEAPTRDRCPYCRARIADEALQVIPKAGHSASRPIVISDDDDEE